MLHHPYRGDTGNGLRQQQAPGIEPEGSRGQRLHPQAERRFVHLDDRARKRENGLLRQLASFGGIGVVSTALTSALYALLRTWWPPLLVNLVALIGTTSTGLGLAIAAALSQAHDGRLELHRNSRGGSTFRLLLPLL